MIKIIGKARRGAFMVLEVQYTQGEDPAIQGTHITVQMRAWLDKTPEERREYVLERIKRERSEEAWAEVEASLAPLMDKDLEEEN